MKKIIDVLAKFANLYPDLFAHLTADDITTICKSCGSWGITDAKIKAEILWAIGKHFSYYDDCGKHFRCLNKSLEYRKIAMEEDAQLRKALMSFNRCFNHE